MDIIAKLILKLMRKAAVTKVIARGFHSGSGWRHHAVPTGGLERAWLEILIPAIWLARASRFCQNPENVTAIFDYNPSSS
jgi:hypothetical protein